MTPSRVASATLLLALAAPLAACGDADAPTGSPDATPMTHRALAAATIDHVGEDASAAAPLFPRDRVPADSIGVEVAFPVAEGDSTHVRVVVSPDVEAFAKDGCDGPRAEYVSGCEEDTVDGVDTVLAWEAGYPEEDPGVISADALHDGWLVSVTVSGPFVEKDLGDLRGLADDLVALAADPAVGFDTSTDYAAEGDGIGDDVWLDWYGQGNGYGPPKGYTGPTDG